VDAADWIPLTSFSYDAQALPGDAPPAQAEPPRDAKSEL